jgi:uncharacterized membrane protein
MSRIRVLLAGESWMTTAFHLKGWDFFSSTTFHSGAHYLRGALERNGIEVVHLPSHEASTHFPLTIDELRRFDAIILSDIGANTLLLHPETWLRGQPMPNRLRLLERYVREGGGLAMAGGYFSFQGIYGAAHYHGTPIENILPVQMSPYDDRVEVPEGFTPEIVDPTHPILNEIPPEWPVLLGYNALTSKHDAQVLARRNQHVILAVGEIEAGRSLAWASDVGPHWCPEQFATWHGFETLWTRAVRWLARKI